MPDWRDGLAQSNLGPLEVLPGRGVAKIATADDLSRRNPYQGSPVDEIGQLILALIRLFPDWENLFNNQRRFPLDDVGHELRNPFDGYPRAMWLDAPDERAG